MSFSINYSDLISTYNEGIDSLIDNIGVVCQLVFPPKKDDCINCVLDPLSKKSANIYITGGPYPFTNGMQCPYCGGRGWVEIESTSEVRMLVIYDPKSYWINSSNRRHQVGSDVMQNMQWRIPDAVVELIGYASNLPALERANYVIVNSAQAGISKNRYKRFGDASLEGFGQNRYFIQFMERVP